MNQVKDVGDFLEFPKDIISPFTKAFFERMAERGLGLMAVRDMDGESTLKVDAIHLLDPHAGACFLFDNGRVAAKIIRLEDIEKERRLLTGK